MFTEEEIRKVRLKSAEPLEISGLERSLFVVKMAGAATLEASEMQEAVKSGKKKQRDFFEFLIANAVCDAQGALLGVDASKELVKFIPTPDMLKIAKAVNDGLSAAAEKSDPGN